MNIRMATLQDAVPLIEFNQAMALETESRRLDPQALKSGVEAVFQDDKKGFYIIAESEEKIVGGLMITFEWSDWRGEWFWWIQSVYILPELRGQGVYRKLYDFVKEKARAQGDVYGFRLYVEKENTPAQQVYKKVGMKMSHYLMYEAKAE